MREIRATLKGLNVSTKICDGFMTTKMMILGILLRHYFDRLLLWHCLVFEPLSVSLKLITKKRLNGYNFQNLFHSQTNLQTLPMNKIINMNNKTTNQLNNNNNNMLSFECERLWAKQYSKIISSWFCDANHSWIWNLMIEISDENNKQQVVGMY